MKKIGFSGTFDPITNGHMWVINEARSLADEVVANYTELWKAMGMTHFRFIRTTDADHVATVQATLQDPSSGATSRTYTIAKAALTHAGTYSCVVKSGGNCAMISRRRGRLSMVWRL